MLHTAPRDSSHSMQPFTVTIRVTCPLPWGHLHHAKSEGRSACRCRNRNTSAICYFLSDCTSMFWHHALHGARWMIYDSTQKLLLHV